MQNNVFWYFRTSSFHALFCKRSKQLIRLDGTNANRPDVSGLQDCQCSYLALVIFARTGLKIDSR